MGGYLPLYEYQCRECGARVEKIQKFSAPVLMKCGMCGAVMERLLSAPAIQFKGAGWYVTDYARKSPSGEASTTEGASTKPKKKESGTSAPAEPAPLKPAAEK
jgi:putative FmdB family regulatory protein